MTEPDLIYYDVDTINNDPQHLDQPLEFLESRNSVYLTNPNEYELSIVRFSISNTSLLPVFIPEIEPNQADINKTVYKVSMTTNLHTSGIINLSYLPSSNDISIRPVSPVGDMQVDSPYYHCYTYQQFVNSINQGLNYAFIALRDATTGAGHTMPIGAVAPYITIDPVTKKLNLFAVKSAYYTFDTLGIKIYINAQLKQLLSSFQYTDYGDTQIPLGKPLRYAFYIEDLFEKGNVVNIDVGLPSLVPYYRLTAQDLDIVIWNPIASIVFTSSILPVVPTNVSAPSVIIYGSGNNTNISSTITDFQVNISADNTYRLNLTYSPQSEYRMFSLNQTTPLNKVNIYVYWKDKYGRAHPVLNPFGSYSNTKLMFRKKTAVLSVIQPLAGTTNPLVFGNGRG